MAGFFCCITTPPPFVTPNTPASSRIAVSNAIFPIVAGSSDVGGWTYLNLNNQNLGVSQNWVVVSMFAEGRFGVESDATSLGNGCSPAPAQTSSARDENSTAGRIGPAKNP